MQAAVSSRDGPRPQSASVGEHPHQDQGIQARPHPGGGVVPAFQSHVREQAFDHTAEDQQGEEVSGQCAVPRAEVSPLRQGWADQQAPDRQGVP